MNKITKPRWMLITLLLICLFTATNTFPSYADSLRGNTDFSTVDAYVESQMKTLKIPGMALAIVQGDQIVYVKGYGQAHPDGSPVTPQTSFMIGSATKSFTALAIMQLVEAGKIELDAPVQTYIPWFRVADGAASALITVRQLLNQTSGFSHATGLTEEFASDLSDTAIEDSVRRLENVALNRAPGTTYEYSNVNFTVAGLIVQTVSGQSYENYVQEHIFEPLEMRNSFTSQDEAIKAGMAMGHVKWFEANLPRIIPFNRGNLPNGYLICSSEDLAHYLIAQLNDGRYGNANVLSPEGIAEMHKPVVPTESPETFYGMAWYIGTINKSPVIYHEGDNGNFQTFLLMLPQEKLGVVVLINVNGLAVNNATKQIAESVTAIVTGTQPQPYNTPEMLPKVIGSVVVPASVSILWVAWMVFRFIRRRNNGLPAKRSFLWILWIIILPLIVDLSLLGVLLFGIPVLWELPLSGISVMFPDMFMLIIVSVLALTGWGVARIVLTLRWARNPPTVRS